MEERITRLERDNSDLRAQRDHYSRLANGVANANTPQELNSCFAELRKFVKNHPWMTVTIVLSAAAAGALIGAGVVYSGLHVVIADAVTTFAASTSAAANNAVATVSTYASSACGAAVNAVKEISFQVVLQSGAEILLRINFLRAITS